MLPARMSDPSALDQAALPRWAGPALGVAVAVGVVARLHSGSALWLDEALTVDIARAPLRDLPEALRHDGSPPLYYALLHVWIRAFGDGDVAVRSLSGVFSLATLPVAWFAGLRVGRDRRTAWYAVALVASSPFAIRFATEARMYSLVAFLTTVGIVAVDRALARPTVGRLAPVAGLGAALMLTHYWAAFVVVSAAATVLAWRRATRVAVAIVAGAGLAVLPWLPVLLHQVAHTGTPWAAAPGLQVALYAIDDFAGGRGQTGTFLALVFLALAAVGVWGRATGPGTLELRWPGERRTGAVAALSFGGLLVGVLFSVLLRSGFAARYAVIALVPFLLVVAVGIRKLPSPGTQVGVLGLCVVLGLLGSIPLIRNPRTQARTVARVLAAEAGPGDVVAYCPDQLGPSVSRLMPVGLDQVAYPTMGAPQRVDWVDYAERNRAAEPEVFAGELLRRAGAGDVWLVWANGYRTFSDDCQRLRDELFKARPETRRVRRLGRYFERMAVTRYSAD
jgi:mannosyltransferase